MKRTPIRKKSKARGIKQKLDLLVRAEVFERDGYRCLKCGRGEPEVQLQAAHVFCKGRWAAMRFIPENVMCLCAGHHLWWHDQPTESGHWFRLMFAERYDQLARLCLTAPKLTLADLKRKLASA